MAEGLRFGDVGGNIENSVIAGRDIDISINIIADVGGEQPSTRNLAELAQRLKEILPRLDPPRAASTSILVDRLEKAIAELPEREREYMERIEERSTRDNAYYVPLSGETVETSQSEPASTWRHSARRRQRRAMADYCEWVPAQREMVRIKLSSLEEGVSKYACIILLGSPGSGKTTALEMIGLQLARMGLGGDRDSRVMLPVPLRLSEYEPGMSVEDFIVQGLSGSLSGDHWDAEALAANLHGYLNEGRMFFLLDALNEMPPEGYSGRASQLRQFIDRWQSVGNRFIVSCRVLDYSEELQGLQRIEILPLNDAQIQQFVLTEITSADRTCEVLWNLYLENQASQENNKILISLEAELRRAGLMSQLEALSSALNPQTGDNHSGLVAMARNPYLLTVIIDVFLDQGRLNLDRSSLMESFVGIQMNWARSKMPPEQWLDAAVQEESLAVLAFEIQLRAGFGTLVKSDQVKAVMPQTVQIDPRWPPVPAPPDKILELAANANIIEMPSDRSNVRFYHQLLQEYFAAQSLLKRDFASLGELWRWPWRREEMPAVGERGTYDPLPPPPTTGWEETVVLAAELAGAAHPELLQQVLSTNPVLAGRCLVESQISIAPPIRDAVVAALLDAINDATISLRVRIAAGDVLGRLGDPRLGSLLAIPKHHVRVEDREHDATYDIDVPEYLIGMFPVTNSEYSRFVASGGYEDRRWWTDAGWQWKGDTRLPEEWENRWYNAPNYPCVGVSWYEAFAYCRWLSAELGKTVRLPNEAEWEIAASGGERRRFPWGDEFDTQRLNIRLGPEIVNRTTPVGIYPEGRSPYGLFDCTGQVWEWCLTPTTPDFRLPAYGSDQTGRTANESLEEGNLGRLLRGASWSDRAEDVAECSHREWFYADFRSDDRGFRVVVANT
jgi:formylglycine-generating enzyme required for sulfatase activity